MTPQISIIIPVFNGENHISHSVSSALNQGFLDENLEIIIINDGSTDNTKQILDTYAKEHKCIKVYHQQNKGIGKTRNISLNYATGKYIYFLDADDFLAPQALHILVNNMLENKLDILGFQTENNNTTTPKEVLENDVKSTLSKAKITTGIEFIESRNFTNTVWWYISDRKFLLNTGFKNSEENQFEDCVFTASLLIKAKKMLFAPLNIHNYYIRSSSIMHSQDPVHIKNMIQMYSNTAISYGQFIKDIEVNDPITEPVLERLKARQQWLSFFGIIRAIRAKIKIKDLKQILANLEEADAYPLNNFIGEDNNGRNLKISTFIFNKRPLLYTVMYTYKIFK